MTDENAQDPKATPNPADRLAGMPTEEKEALVMSALHTVVDPEIGLSVKELGLIRGLTIQDDRAHVVMILTTPFCPYAPQLLEAARRTVQETLGVPTTIEVGPEYWDPSMAEEGVLNDWGLF